MADVLTNNDVVTMEGVSWTYAGADAPALAGLDLKIAPGELVVLAGPSGSGKSTALRLMNGIISHLTEGTMQGKVEVAGLDPHGAELAATGRRTGSVWQHPFRQFFAGTVTDEIAFALENHAEPPDRIRQRVGALLQEHGIQHLGDRRLATLSSGQQQLVAMLAAIVHRPPVLLLDEPSANLSEAATALLVATLAGLKRDGMTIIVAEHRVHPFAPIADRIVSFGDGRVQDTWTPGVFERMSDAQLQAGGLRPRLIPASRASEASLGADGGIVVGDISCVRGGRTVLEVAGAHFPAGSVTALRGANGSGKTTLARILAGLQKHRGRVLRNGRPVSRAARRASTMLLSQEVQRQLFADTVEGELELVAGALTHPDDVQLLLAELGLERLVGRHPLSLSGGEQQRLAVAVARLSRRPVVILDEPSTGVDAHHLSTISSMIRSMAVDGSAAILISHDEHLLNATADVEVRLEGSAAN